MPVLPLRSEARHSSEMVDQLLFGDTYELLSLREEWCEVSVCGYSYRGWISRKQHTPLTEGERASVERWPLIVRKPVASVTLCGRETLIPMGSRLPEADVAVCGIAIHHDLSGASLQTPIEVALQLYGAPYLWGGKSCMGIDCSGLSQLAYRLCGIMLPRDASQQALVGSAVGNDIPEANDLLFFHNEAGRVVHVGIYMGGGKIIHASGRVRIDPVDAVGIVNTDTGQYSHRLHSIRRIVKEK